MKPIAKNILLLVNKLWPIYIQINIFIVDAINPIIQKNNQKALFFPGQHNPVQNQRPHITDIHTTV